MVKGLRVNPLTGGSSNSSSSSASSSSSSSSVLSLRALGKPIAAQLADLRSSVVSTLCHTLLALAQVCLCSRISSSLGHICSSILSLIRRLASRLRLNPTTTTYC